MPAGLSAQIAHLTLYPDLTDLDFEQIFHPPNQSCYCHTCCHRPTFTLADYSGNMKLWILNLLTLNS